MASSTPKTIMLENQNPVIKEKVAVSAINPGHLIERTSADKVQVHSVAGGNASPLIAVEDDLQGRDIDDNYAAAERVKYVTAQPGDRFYMWLANGESVAIGDLLESAGNGELRKHVADLNDSTTTTIYQRSIVFQADEAVDMSDSSGADPAGRIKVTAY